uniref:Transmembrane protein n=1 Tax=Anguilla anguilla TaxID=7936 RepID=A0A0E9QBG8_ANGAN
MRCIWEGRSQGDVALPVAATLVARPVAVALSVGFFTVHSLCPLFLFFLCFHELLSRFLSMFSGSGVQCSRSLSFVFFFFLDFLCFFARLSSDCLSQ